MKVATFIIGLVPKPYRLLLAHLLIVMAANEQDAPNELLTKLKKSSADSNKINIQLQFSPFYY